MKIDNLIEVLGIQSESYDTFDMEKYLVDFCEVNKMPFFMEDGSIYITKGKTDSYPCIVAHTDTVHDICENLTVININGNLTGFNSILMQQTGIGGDDKVGIFIALQCLLKFDCVKVAFFRDEEVGCEGSYNANIDFFSDCNFVLQCDRKGSKDFITNASGVELSSKDFQIDIKPILKKFKYKFENGMMTDVMALKEIGINCSCANISCGYYNPHSINEYVNIKDVSNCLDLVFSIIENLGANNYYHEYKYKRVKDNYIYDYSKYERQNKSKKDSQDDLYSECDSCGNISLNTKFVSDYNCFLCDDCDLSLHRWENEDYRQKVLQFPINK